LKQLKRHLTVANVLSAVALFMALGGAAYAAKVMLPKKSVKTQNLANGAVTNLKLRNGAVTPLKIRNGAVTGAKIAPGAVGSTQLADGGVRSVDLGGGVVTEAKLKNGAVTENKLGANSVATGKIQDGAVTGAKLSAALLAQLVDNVSYVSKVSATDEASPKTATAECPAGKQVVGGGAKIVSGDATVVQLTESIPFVASDGKRTGWTAAAKTSEAGKTFGVEAHAICAEF
jgi:hypothetical protein